MRESDSGSHPRVPHVNEKYDPMVVGSWYLVGQKEKRFFGFFGLENKINKNSCLENK